MELYSRAEHFLNLHENGKSFKEIAKLHKVGEELVKDHIKVIKAMKQDNMQPSEFEDCFFKLRNEDKLFCSIFK